MKELRNISISSENYLEVIYELAQNGRSVRSVDVANRLKVSKASVNKAVSVLRQAGMVEHQLYGTITLTEMGKGRAMEVDHRHKTIKRFLVEVLEVDEAIADEDACRMEHVVSDVTMKRWTNYLEKTLLVN